uniref:Peroxisomal biogenesis factor 19 n=1 Tax=Neogobius melanostomus TaxID=47308 RepID=A0A8C6WJ78_9GOBI
MASEAGKSSSGHDAELDELLDSALDDFDKAAAPPPAAEAAAPSDASGAEKPPLLEDCKLFETLFEGEMANQAREEWEKAMSELAQQEPDLLEHFQKLSEAAGKVGTDTASQQEFTSCLKTLSKACLLHLLTSGMAGEDLVKALEGLALEEGGGEGGDEANILPIMQSFMQNLLSKEVLYPSLKEITTKYPEWLEVNKPTLSSEDFQRYEKQAKIMGKSANCSRERRREPRRKRAPSRPSWTSCRRCIYRNTAILGSCHEFYITHGSVLFSALCGSPGSLGEHHLSPLGGKS